MPIKQIIDEIYLAKEGERSQNSYFMSWNGYAVDDNTRREMKQNKTK